MKKLCAYGIIPALLSLVSIQVSGQTTTSKIQAITTKDISKLSQSKDLIRTANDLKSGNWQDVMSGFFQLAAGDLAGSNHSVSFKSNLLALKVKADSSLLIDTNYVKQKFARNFQFDFSLKLDSVYHFNGFNAGFTWAIVNKRDNSVVQFINNSSQSFYDKLIKSANSFENSLWDTAKLDIKNWVYRKVNDTSTIIIMDSFIFQKMKPYGSLKRNDTSFIKINDGTFIYLSPANLNLFLNTKNALKTMLNDSLFSVARLPKEFQKFASKKLDSLFAESEKKFNAFLDEVAMQPLLTLSADGNFDKQKGSLNGGDAQLVYLQGISSKSGSRFESDIRAGFSEKDTTLNNSSVRRSVLDINAGFNISWVKNKKSIVEFKPYLEYKNIMQGISSGENQETFYASGDLRIRVTDNLWIPLTIKYDTKKGNFLGFLNVSLNMNAFKKP